MYDDTMTRSRYPDANVLLIDEPDAFLADQLRPMIMQQLVELARKQEASATEPVTVDWVDSPDAPEIHLRQGDRHEIRIYYAHSTSVVESLLPIETVTEDLFEHGVLDEVWDVAGMQITSLGHELLQGSLGGETDWLVPGVLVEGGYTLLYALPKAGKSLVAIALAIAASHGGNWIGLHQFDVPIGVLYIDDDANNANEWRRRMRLMGGNPRAPRLRSMLQQGFIITDLIKRNAILNLCAKHDIRLVIIDSYKSMHELKEGNSDDMKIVSNGVKQFTSRGITVVVLHHESRRGGARGSGEILAAPDTLLNLKKIDKHHFEFRPESQRSEVEDGWTGSVISVEQTQTTLALTTEPLEEAESTGVNYEQRVTDYFGTHPDWVAYTAIYKATKCNGANALVLKQALLDLEDDALVETRKKGKAVEYRWIDNEAVLEDEE